jgi:hypothetical protein
MGILLSVLKNQSILFSPVGPTKDHPGIPKANVYIESADCKARAK